MRAIILDDDPLILSVLTRTLHRLGHDVASYTDPTLCPIYTSKCCPCQNPIFCPHFIISDFDMPHINGILFLEELHKKGCRCRHFAIMSGSSIPKIILERIAGLNVKFFAKPFETAQITSWLRQIEPYAP